MPTGTTLLIYAYNYKNVLKPLPLCTPVVRGFWYRSLASTNGCLRSWMNMDAARGWIERKSTESTYLDKTFFLTFFQNVLCERRSQNTLRHVIGGETLGTKIQLLPGYQIVVSLFRIVSNGKVKSNHVPGSAAKSCFQWIGEMQCIRLLACTTKAEIPMSSCSMYHQLCVHGHHGKHPSRRWSIACHGAR